MMGEKQKVKSGKVPLQANYRSEILIYQAFYYLILVMRNKLQWRISQNSYLANFLNHAFSRILLYIVLLHDMIHPWSIWCPLRNYLSSSINFESFLLHIAF